KIWTPQGGAVYRVTDQVSLFGNYSESFTPSVSIDRNNETLDPETAQGHEFGLKVASEDNRFTASMAYFDQTRQNVATADPVFAFASIAIGEQNATGFEFEFFGELFPNFTVQAGYAFIDAITTADTDIAPGSQVGGVPDHSASLWCRYNFEGGPLDGLGIGGGFRHVGEFPLLFEENLFVDGYTVTQLGLFYDVNDWKFSVFFENLLDRRALRAARAVGTTGGAGFVRVYDLAPTEVVAKITKKF
ncbi:MAG: TonB-dependent receptor, partial [Verrucomicrobiota bacterium]